MCTDDDIFHRAYVGLLKLSKVNDARIIACSNLLTICGTYECNLKNRHYAWHMCKKNTAIAYCYVDIDDVIFMHMNEHDKEKFVVQSIVDICKNDDVRLSSFTTLPKGTSLEELAVIGDLAYA